MSYTNNLKFDKNYFSKIDSKEKAYYFGFICADGTHNKYQFKIKIRSKDREILDRFKSSIASDHNIYLYGEDVTFRICSRSLCNQLDLLGCPARKSLILKYPDIDVSFNRDFIRGVYDGDGWFVKDQWGIVSGSKKFLNRIRQILNEEVGLNIKLYVAEKNKNNRKNSLYSICVSDGPSLIKLYHYLYNNVDLYLNRKYIAFSEKVIKIMGIIRKREERALIKSDRKSGMTYAEIAKKYNITLKQAADTCYYKYVAKYKYIR